MPTGIDDDLETRVTHGYADHDGVRLHYASVGAGPLVVMLHGFPDYWYTWRHQMVALADRYQVVAPDLRGYNESDHPAGEAQYEMSLLVGDVAAVIRACGRERAVIVGHDWGGAIAWQTAMHLPSMTERLIVLNVPHPAAMARELTHNPEMQTCTAYARDFQHYGASAALPWEMIATAPWVSDPVARAKHVTAIARSDRDAMMHYYRRSYPRPPYLEAPTSVPVVQAPTLVIYGRDDPFFVPEALDGTWRHVQRDVTLLMISGAGHFVQLDAAALVSHTMQSWLADRTSE